MTDYISREAAIEAMYKDAEAHPDHTFWTSQFEALMDIPAADVRPVVTCIECKYSCDMPGGLRCCYGNCVDCYVDPEYFCADGEKREES